MLRGLSILLLFAVIWETQGFPFDLFGDRVKECDCACDSKGDTKICTGALDQLAVMSRRSEFTWYLDAYIRSDLYQPVARSQELRDMWEKISSLICPSFREGWISTPKLMIGPFLNSTSFLEWLFELPETRFAGFAEHHIVNLRLEPDSDCRPTVIRQMNYSPNWLRIRPVESLSTAITVSELSTEDLEWIRGPQSESLGRGEWCINAYRVNSTHLFWEKTRADLYAAPDTWIVEGGLSGLWTRLMSWFG